MNSIVQIQNLFFVKTLGDQFNVMYSAFVVEANPYYIYYYYPCSIDANNQS